MDKVLGRDLLLTGGICDIYGWPIESDVWYKVVNKNGGRYVQKIITESGVERSVATGAKSEKNKLSTKRNTK